MKYSKFLVTILLLGTFYSCNKKFDSLLINPNGPSPDAADVDAFLNQAQISFSGFYTTASDLGAGLSRQQALTGGNLYENAFSPQSYDGIWNTAYTGIVKHVDALIPLAEAQKKYQQEGIGKLLKAYAMLTLVDAFGDIPYSEANLGIGNINPKTDGGQAVYTSILALIDEAIANLNNADQDTKALPKTDLFYNGDIAKWTAFANTLKLKLYMQERLVTDVSAQVTALETENNLIKTSSQDFQFLYGKNTSSPDTRHPHYTANYLGGGAGDYISNQFMYTITVKKTGVVSSTDPRRRYYFYRQVGNYDKADPTTCQCITAYDNGTPPSWYLAGMPFCLVGSNSGYWGRDHGDASGIGPDNYNRTAWGLYPAGGKFDESTFSALSSTDLGAGGKGIDPIWLSAYTYFLEAEAALTLGVTVNGDARALLEQGIRASISKVLGFPTQIGFPVNATYIPTQATVDAYVIKVLGNYDAADDNGKLNIVMEEYYIALFGNGVEPYNNLRRTGKPENLQYMVTTANPGFFIRSYFYPSVFVNSNSNAPAQKTPGLAVQKVFWDTNPDDFIK